jgi:hypothetical protein
LSRLINYLRLSSQDKRLVLGTFGLLGIIRVGLWLLPFQTLRNILAKFTPVPGSSQATANSETVKKIVRTVRSLSHYIPRATCLTQALAVTVLLSRRGQPASLQIGVSKGERGRLEAHAWVEIQGRIVIGKQSNHSRYAVLSSLEKAIL